VAHRARAIPFHGWAIFKSSDRPVHTRTIQTGDRPTDETTTGGEPTTTRARAMSTMGARAMGRATNCIGRAVRVFSKTRAGGRVRAKTRVEGGDEDGGGGALWASAVDLDDARVDSTFAPRRGA
jgi:hypothetical protein